MLLVVYLAVTGAALILGAARVTMRDLLLHVALLVVVAVATWRREIPDRLRVWVPLLALPALYAEMPALIRAVGHDGIYDLVVIAWEQRLFGGQPAAELADRWPGALGSELLHAAYVSYYGIIFVVPVALAASRRGERLPEAVLLLMLTFVVCFLSYLAFPVAGPRYLWPPPESAESGPTRALALWLLDAGSSRGTAFPSSHVAVAVTQSLLAIRYFGSRGAGLAVLTIALAVGAVYGGFHYAIDVLAGALVGALVPWVALRARHAWITRTAGQANATAPT